VVRPVRELLLVN